MLSLQELNSELIRRANLQDFKTPDPSWWGWNDIQYIDNWMSLQILQRSSKDFELLPCDEKFFLRTHLDDTDSPNAPSVYLERKIEEQQKIITQTLIEFCGHTRGKFNHGSEYDQCADEIVSILSNVFYGRITMREARARISHAKMPFSRS
jgi:hypothetical protein